MSLRPRVSSTTQSPKHATTNRLTRVLAAGVDRIGVVTPKSVPSLNLDADEIVDTVERRINQFAREATLDILPQLKEDRNALEAAGYSTNYIVVTLPTKGPLLDMGRVSATLDIEKRADEVFAIRISARTETFAGVECLPPYEQPVDARGFMEKIRYLKSVYKGEIKEDHETLSAIFADEELARVMSRTYDMNPKVIIPFVRKHYDDAFKMYKDYLDLNVNFPLMVVYEAATRAYENVLIERYYRPGGFLADKNMEEAMNLM